MAATLELHATVGPARTSIAAIAARAGVQRHTVYRHFPTLDALFDACTRHGMASTGMPDGDAWLAIDDPLDRTRHGLRQLVAWFRANRDMLDRVLTDAPPGPADPSDPYAVRIAHLRTALAAPWRVPTQRTRLFEAVLAHALAYETWRSLSAGGLDDEAVVATLVGWVAGAASAGAAPTDV